MITIIYMAAILFWGWRVVNRVRLSRNGFAQLSAAYLIGLFFSTWLAFILALAGKNLHWGIVPAISSLMILHGLYLKAAGASRHNWHISWPLPVFWILVMVPNFLLGCIPDRQGNLCIISNYDDLAYHWAMISHFAEPRLFFLENPQADGHGLFSPFMINFHTALLVKGGWSYLFSIIVNQVLLATALLILAWHFLAVFLTRFRAALIAMVLIFCSHVGFFNVLVALTGKPVCDQIFIPGTTLPPAEQAALWLGMVKAYYFNFLHPVMNLFHPQRPFLAGFPLFIMALLYARSGILQGRKGTGPVLFAMTIIGLMPLFHIHSFLLAAGIVSIVVMRTRKYHGISPAVFAPLLLAVPQLLFLRSPGGADYSGWDALANSCFHETVRTGAAFIDHCVFWVRAGGLAVLLAPPALIIWFRFLKTRSSIHCRCSYLFVTTGALLGTSVIILANFYRFTPNWGDCNKFFFYYLVFISILTAHWWSRAWGKSVLGRALITATMVCCIGVPYSLDYMCDIAHPMFCLGRSALKGTELTAPVFTEKYMAPALARQFINYAVFLSREDLQMGEWLRANLPGGAVLATSDDTVHYAACLSGRVLVDGAYTNETISGREEIKKQMEEAYSTGNMYLFRKLGATHIIAGPREKLRYQALPSLWKYRPLYVMKKGASHHYVFSVHAPEKKQGEPSQAADGRPAWLCDMMPIEVKQEICPPAVNQSLQGTAISLGGRLREKGIAAHAHSRIVYRLDRHYQALSGMVGIDDSQRGEPGSVVFHVWGDGRELWKSRLIRADGTAVPFRVSLENIAILVLEVTDGDDGNHFDQGSWGTLKLE